MTYKKIKNTLKMFEDGDVNQVTIDVDDVIITITKKGYNTHSDNFEQEWIVYSPFVGVVHLNNAEKRSFIESDQVINKNETVCIIESMKIQHELLSDYSGIITEIYVQDKQFVEYNQPMIKIKRL